MIKPYWFPDDLPVMNLTVQTEPPVDYKTLDEVKAAVENAVSEAGDRPSDEAELRMVFWIAAPDAGREYLGLLESIRDWVKTTYGGEVVRSTVADTSMLYQETYCLRITIPPHNFRIRQPIP